MPWMTGNVVRNLLHGPVTRPYPAARREPFARTRGKIAFEASRCEFCGDCERVCPSQAIILDTVWDQGDGGHETTWVRIYRPLLCIFCGVCVEICAYGALTIEEEHLPPTDHKVDERGYIQSW